MKRVLLIFIIITSFSFAEKSIYTVGVEVRENILVEASKKSELIGRGGGSIYKEAIVHSYNGGKTTGKLTKKIVVSIFKKIFK